MLTGGQLGSLFSGGGGASSSACDLVPKISLNRLPSPELLAAVELAPAFAPPIELPPPQPASITLNKAATNNDARLRTGPP
jgi:hypothetical protein